MITGHNNRDNLMQKVFADGYKKSGCVAIRKDTMLVNSFMSVGKLGQSKI